MVPLPSTHRALKANSWLTSGCPAIYGCGGRHSVTPSALEQSRYEAQSLHPVYGLKIVLSTLYE